MSKQRTVTRIVDHMPSLKDSEGSIIWRIQAEMVDENGVTVEEQINYSLTNNGGIYCRTNEEVEEAVNLAANAISDEDDEELTPEQNATVNSIMDKYLVYALNLPNPADFDFLMSSVNQLSLPPVADLTGQPTSCASDLTE